VLPQRACCDGAAQLLAGWRLNIIIAQVKEAATGRAVIDILRHILLACVQQYKVIPQEIP
jgi:septum formation topological specificity factor MinE